ncbi:MAG: lipoprotein insertase outer membrane protein LolB [Proteobacteria bacterium]|nr:lipoprotein insertase outer membrane protein LolB [Pseudomonadota bacterium]
MYKNLLNISLCILLFTLTACNKNNVKQSIQFSNWQQVAQWSFVGKMAISNGQDSGSGKVEWHVTNTQTLAKFKAPLGQGSWQITVNNQQARLLSSRRGESFADNAEDLIANEIGWYFPWNNLQFWLRGFTSEQQLLVHQNLPKILHDDGWQITYQQWRQTPIGWLPKKIKASKPPYSVKLIIYQWTIN